MSLDNELKSIAQAYLSMHEKKKTVDEEEKVDCPKCEGTGKVDGDDCGHCDGKGYHMKDNDDDDDKDDDMDEAMDPVNKKALKKDFDDRKDKDIDNDGDTDDSDEYLHKRRKAVSKAMAKESYNFDWDTILEMDDTEIDTYIDSLDEDDLQKFASEFDSLAEAATAQLKPKADEQEKLEPRAAAEKDWASKTTKDKKVVDRPDANNQDGSDKVKVAGARKGDNMTGERSMKTLKDVRK